MSDLEVPPVIRQREVVEQIARDAVARVDGEWESLTVNLRKLAPWGQFETIVERPDGSIQQKFPPRDSGKYADELRSLMYKPGAGTWFSAKVAISKTGAVGASFDYDNEPAWSRPAEPIFYAQDLKLFPRDESAQPEWLRAQLALAPEDA